MSSHDVVHSCAERVWDSLRRRRRIEPFLANECSSRSSREWILSRSDLDIWRLFSLPREPGIIQGEGKVIVHSVAQFHFHVVIDMLSSLPSAPLGSSRTSLTATSRIVYRAVEQCGSKVIPCETSSSRPLSTNSYSSTENAAVLRSCYPELSFLRRRLLPLPSHSSLHRNVSLPR